MRSRSPWQRRDVARRPTPTALTAAVSTAALAALLCGCGIRATSVPVDAGAAPSRVSCVVPGQGGSDTEGSDGVRGNPQARVYLLCSARVSSVERRVDLPEPSGTPTADERLPAARKLLDELQAEPSPDEDAAGFESAVPAALKVTGPVEGDATQALRLSMPLEDLPSFALAQIVCTYAESDAVANPDHTTVLAGPPGTGEPPQRFECDAELRTRPAATETAGTRM